ncbi:MAG: hypothetical protein ABJD11_16885 [Gemmatimonadota bacterium]
MQWETRYSSCEMLYLDVTGTEVRSWLNSDTSQGLRWSIKDVLAGKADGTIGLEFGGEVLDELKAYLRTHRT